MKRLVYFLAAIACCAVSGHAQTKDVPEAARREVARRGYHVEATGTIRSGLIAAAFAHPADDSHKWFITLVGKPGEPVFEQMKLMIANGKDHDLLAWIDTVAPTQSTTHYQVRNVNDDTQKDWLKGLQPAIDKYGLPAIVLQPPRSGQFGDPTRIVKAVHGELTAKQLAAKLREGVIAYVEALEAPIHSGVSQTAPVGVAPPFNVPQPNAPVPAPVNPLPIDWPPSAPAPLTIEQIKTTCPGATAEFILQIVDSKESSLETVKLRWLVFQLQQTKQEKPKPELSPVPDPDADSVIVRPRSSESIAENPSQPATRIPREPLAVEIFLGMLAVLVVMMILFAAGWLTKTQLDARIALAADTIAIGRMKKMIGRDLNPWTPAESMSTMPATEPQKPVASGTINGLPPARIV